MGGIRVLLKILAVTSLLNSALANATDAPVAIAIHGGAGTILKKNLSDEKERQIRRDLEIAVTTGYELLKAGKTGVEAVVATIQILEDSAHFNAGIGAVYTYDGEHELDASIMHGQTLNAGAVAGVKTIKSPIAAALAVMQKSEHVMLSGIGAETFAQQQGLEMVENSYFNTPFRYEALKRAKAKLVSAHSRQTRTIAERAGTVGAVVLDQEGNLVAGTSTGGMTAKRFGRVGDSPIIGAGTYADNESCAVSATGHGEFFIRYHVAADICARMKYSKSSLKDAANTVIHDVLLPAGGTGGIIAVDKQGNIAMPFNTPGMYRASVDSSGNVYIGIYANENG